MLNIVADICYIFRRHVIFGPTWPVFSGSGYLGSRQDNNKGTFKLVAIRFKSAK